MRWSPSCRRTTSRWAAPAAAWAAWATWTCDIARAMSSPRNMPPSAVIGGRGSTILAATESPASCRAFCRALATRVTARRGPGTTAPSARCPFGRAALLRGAAKASRLVVVDHAHRLHPRVDDHRTHELEAARLERLRECDRLARLGEALRAAGFRRAADVRPGEGGEVLAGRLHREIGAGVADRRFDLGARAHDARIAEQPLDIAFGEARDLCRIETAERLAERGALGEDRAPREAHRQRGRASAGSRTLRAVLT